jgi:hypothetical protein
VTYTATTAGVYYFRVRLYSGNPTPYTFTISINGVLKSTYYDTAYFAS